MFGEQKLWRVLRTLPTVRSLVIRSGGRSRFLVALVLGFVGCHAGAAWAVSPTASATFCVTVPSILGVSGPAVPLSLTHDGTAGLQTFALEPFTLLSNQAAGAVVTFDCIGGFIHTTDALLTRDCILGATLDTADATSGWAVDVAADQTHLTDLIPDLTAQVQLSSTAPGDAVMNLEVCMDGGDPALLPPGVYCTVIVATIAAN